MIHRFDDPSPLDQGTAARLLGGKGASLAQMTRMGLPVPPGFTLSTDLYRHYDREGGLPEDLPGWLRESVAEIEERMGARFGGDERPLLLAVRSAGPSSLPGMLETVLDVGIAPGTLGALESLGDRRFALDVRRRFVESYASVVLGVPRTAFAALLGRREVTSLDADALEALLEQMEELVRHESGEGIPEDPWVQLLGSIRGVLDSWRTPRAQKYRDAQGISNDEGTAVIVQAMAFGNLDPRSGAGVVFSRNPSTGERVLFGEWLAQGQGEDVVSGRQTPAPLTVAQLRRGMDDTSLETALPQVYAELGPICDRLEAHFGDVVDIEIAVESGRLFVLQCRNAKRTARAAARIAVEMQREGVVPTRTQALRQVDPASLRQLLTPRLPDPEVLAEKGIGPIARGLAASPGAAAGRVVLDAEAARSHGDGEELILVRADTSAEDVETIRAVSGVLTSAGGLTSHAAVVARAIGKPCVTGATNLHVDYTFRQVVAKLGGQVLREGDLVTIDGSRGLVYADAVTVEPAPASEHVETILEWADATREAEVLAEATTPRLATIGLRFGADGVAALGGASDALASLVEAAGDAPVLARAEGEEAVRVALDTLRPGRDRLLVPLADLERALAIRGDRAIPVWTEGPSGAEGCLIESEAEIGSLRPETAIVFRADESSQPLLAAALAGHHPVTLVVPPLDVPVGRLLAGQA